jgi:cytochrome P450
MTCGMMVLVGVYFMQQDPNVWEEPERFMGDDNVDGGSRWMMPSGMGRKRCPNEGLALRMIGAALGVMMQCFEWVRVGGKEVDMMEVSGLTMHKEVPLVVVCRPRALFGSL